MWWGGSEGAEAAAEAVEAAPEIEDMKEQFEMQQNLIKQLKDMVKTHQTQMQEKEQQVQRLNAAGTERSCQLASLTERMAAVEEDGAASQSPVSTAGAQPRRQRMLEIKRQLEEQRRAQEERVREPRVDIEAMVRSLQSRIQNPDYRYDSCDSAESGSDGEIEFGSSPRKSMTLSDSVREKPPEELYGVILAKDNRIYELSDKVSQLEATVVDLKDTLQEKESVISARTKAVSLVTRALTERGQVTMDTLDETRQQMKDMQEAFAVHEADWKVREEKLTKQLQTATDSLETAEENCKKMEAAKFDLVIANANLQEKLVKIQASAKIESGRAASLESELAAVKRELADSQKMVFRVKSQKRQRLGQLEGEAGQLSERCAQLEAQLAERADNGQLEAERDRLQHELSERLSELTAITSRLCEMERSREAAEEELRAKDAQLADLQAKMAELARSSGDSDALVSKLTAERSDLEQQACNLAVALEETSATSREKVDSEQTEAHARLAGAQAKLTETDSTLIDTEVRLEESSTRLAESGVKLSDTEARLTDTEINLKETEARLAEASAQVAEVRTGSEAADTELATIRASLQKSTAELAETRQKLNTAVQELAEARAQAEVQADRPAGRQADALPKEPTTAEVSSQHDLIATSEAASQAERETTEAASQAVEATSGAFSQHHAEAVSAVDCSTAVGAETSRVVAEESSGWDDWPVVEPVAEPATSTSSLTALQSQLEVLATDLETSRCLLQESRDECAALQQENSRLHEAELGRQQERRLLQQEAGRLQTDLRSAEELASELQSGNKQLLERLETEKGHQEAEPAELTETAGDQPQTDLKKIVKKLKTRLKQELKAKSALEEKIGVLKSRVPDLQSSIAEMERVSAAAEGSDNGTVRLAELRGQWEQEREARLSADRELAEVRAALEELQARHEAAAQEPAPVREEAKQQATAPEPEILPGGATAPDQQKVKLMKAKLLKELQAKAELQKQLSERETTVEEIRRGLEERDSSLEEMRVQMTNREAALERVRAELSERDAALDRVGSELEEVRESLARLAASEGDLQSRLEPLQAQLGVTEAEMARLSQQRGEEDRELASELSAAAQTLLEQTPTLLGVLPADSPSAAAWETLQPKLAGWDALPPLPTRCSQLAEGARLLARAAAEQRAAGHRDPFDLFPPLRDRSSSQSSLMSERSESARSEPPGAEGERDVLLLKQQTRLKQLATAVRRRTAMRDEALARVKELEEEAEQLRARLEELEKSSNATSPVREGGGEESEKWEAELAEKDIKIAALEESLYKQKCEEERAAAHLSSLADELKEKGEKIASLEGLISAQNKEEMDALNLSTKVNEQQAALEALTAERDEKGKRIACLEEAQTGKDDKIRYLLDELTAKEAALSSVVERSAALGERVTVLSSQLQGVKVDVADLQAQQTASDMLSALNPAELESLPVVAASRTADSALAADVKTLMQQLRALPAAEASTLFRVPHGMDVVSLPSSGSEGHPRDSSEDNWSVVDERPGSGAASPATAATAPASVPAGDTSAAAAAAANKDASPPSESSEPVTVVAASASNTGWDDGGGWDDWGMMDAEQADRTPSAPPADEEVASPGLLPVKKDAAATVPPVSDQAAPQAEVSLIVTAGDSWGWSAEEEAATGLPSGQWGWDEDAGWPLDDQPPSEALQLGNTEMITQHVPGGTEMAEQGEGQVSADALASELTEVRALLLTTQREVSELAAERARLLQQLEVGGTEETPAEPETSQEDQQKTAEAPEAAVRLEEVLNEVARLRAELTAAETERGVADRSLEDQRVDASHQWSVLNHEISILRDELDSTVSDLAGLRQRLETSETEKAECERRFVVGQQEADRLTRETHALRASQLETEQQRQETERLVEWERTATAAAVQLAERTLAELRAATGAVERLEDELRATRAESEAAGQSAGQQVAAVRAEGEAALQQAAEEVRRLQEELATARQENEAVGEKAASDAEMVDRRFLHSMHEAEVVAASNVERRERDLPSSKQEGEAAIQSTAADIERLQGEPASAREGHETVVRKAAADVERMEAAMVAARDEANSAAHKTAAGVERLESELQKARTEAAAATQRAADDLETAERFLLAARDETEGAAADVQRLEQELAAVRTGAGPAWEDAVVPSGQTQPPPTGGPDGVPPPLADRGYPPQEEGFVRQEVAQQFTSAASRGADQGGQHAAFGSKPSQASSYFGHQPDTYNRSAQFLDQPQGEAGGSFGPQHQTDSYHHQVSERHPGHAGFFSRDNQGTAGYFAQDSHYQTGGQNNQQMGGYFNQDSQRTTAAAFDQSGQVAAYFNQPQQSSAGFFQQTLPPQQGGHGAPAPPEEPAVVPSDRHHHHHHHHYQQQQQQSGETYPAQAADPAPVSMFSMFGGAQPADPFDEVWPAQSAAPAPAQPAASPSVGEAPVPEAGQEATGTPSAAGIPAEEPVLTGAERDAVQRQLEAALRERQELQERLQALGPATDYQERFELALRERQELQDQLKAVTDHEERLNLALNERDELRLRVQDLEMTGEQLREALCERELVEGELAEARRQLETARHGLQLAEQNAQRQLNLQALETETKVEQLELRIADLEPLQGRLRAAERRAEESELQLEGVAAERLRLRQVELELQQSRTTLEAVSAEKGRLERQAASCAAAVVPPTVEPVIQAAVHVMSAAPPPAGGFQFASSLFGDPAASAPAADFLDSFGLAPAATAQPPSAVPPAPVPVEKAPTLAEDIAEQLTLLRSETEQMRARLAEAEPAAARCRQLEAEVERLRQELTGNERGEAAELESAAAENTLLWERINSMEHEVNDLRAAAAENASLRETISRLEQEAAALKEVQAESAALRERIPVLEGESATLTLRLGAAEAEKAALQSVVASLEATTAAGASSEAASPEIAELRRQLTESQESYAALQAENAAADADLAATKTQLQQYIDYCNYYAAYYAQDPAAQQPAQAQTDPAAATAQQGDTSQQPAPEAAAQELYAGWSADSAAVSAAAARDETAVPTLAVSELEPTPQQPAGSELSSVNLYSPAALQDAMSDADVADAVVSAAQSVIPSVLSFFGGGGGGAAGAAGAVGAAAAGAEQPGEAQQRLEQLRAENETLRARVSELELSLSASRAAGADPLVAPTSSPFLEEAGSPPLRSEWSWQEFTPALEAVTPPPSEASSRPSELERVSAELQAEREKVARLEAAAAELWERPTAEGSDKLANVVRELQTERERMAQLQEEAEELRQQAETAASAAEQLTAAHEQAAQLQQETVALQLEVARLSSELEAERSQPQQTQVPGAVTAPPAADEVAQLSSQLAEELANVTQLSGELESERADVARLEGEVQLLRDVLTDAQVQLSTARSAGPADSALSDQLAFYRQKVTELETTLAGAKEELQQAKVKNGRLLQKLKVQQKAARGAAAAPDALDTAMLEEAQSLAAEALKRADDAERQARELQQEKARLANQVGTFQDAQERLLESKERLETELHALRVENDRLRSQMSDMEWRLAELEEAAESREGSVTTSEAAPAATEPTPTAASDTEARAEAARLSQEKAEVEQRLAELERRNEELLAVYQTAMAAGADNQLQQSVEQLQLQLDGAATENAALNERLAAYEAHWLAQSAAGVQADQPRHVDAATSPPLRHLTGADPAAPAPAGTAAAHSTPLSEAAAAAAAVAAAAAAEEVPTDQSPILRSREVIIHGMAEELSSQRATIAALRAEAAQWRTLAEEGEDGDVVEGLNEHLRQLSETLYSRDARCHQLTTEVAQLLEERDLLQLRLSSALRSNQSRTAEVSPQSTADDSADVQQLKIKLAELKQLNYLLDIQLQGEVAERRRLQRSLQTDSPQHGRHSQMTLSPNTSDLVSSSSKDI